MKKILILISLSLPASMLLNTGCSKVNSPESGSPDNIILMIGDGMGVAQVYAGMTANGGKLALERCSHTGFQKTYSASSYITDSGAGGTALACGEKTNNKSIGVDVNGKPLKSILKYAEGEGLVTGLVASCAITHATPASFIANNRDRDRYEEIALDFLDTGFEVLIGGGRDHFEKREDGLNLLDSLRARGYYITDDLQDTEIASQSRLAAFTAGVHPLPVMEGRGDMLPVGTLTAIQILEAAGKGFFLMVEGSQIDWGAHKNNTDYVVSEMMDFDRAVAVALDFAEKDGNTLVIVTADHETGGMTVNEGDFATGSVTAEYTSKGHTGVMVPVFAFGPGAEKFSGIYENTEVFIRMMSCFGISR